VSQPPLAAPSGPVNPYATLRDPAAAISSAYTISREVVIRSEQKRWLRHCGDSSSSSSSSSDDGDGDEEEVEPQTAPSAPQQQPAAHPSGNRPGLTDPPGAGSSSNKAPAAAAAAGSSSTGPGQPGTSLAASGLPAALREKLLAAAPKLEVSGDVRVPAAAAAAAAAVGCAGGCGAALCCWCFAVGAFKYVGADNGSSGSSSIVVGGDDGAVSGTALKDLQVVCCCRPRPRHCIHL
jgi:hypothetical protein